MAECELLTRCIFFNDRMASMPSTAEVIKLRYCKSDNTDCARHMIFRTIGRDKVPQELFPNQMEQAMRIIEEGWEDSSKNNATDREKIKERIRARQPKKY